MKHHSNTYSIHAHLFYYTIIRALSVSVMMHFIPNSEHTSTQTLLHFSHSVVKLLLILFFWWLQFCYCLAWITTSVQNAQLYNFNIIIVVRKTLNTHSKWMLNKTHNNLAFIFCVYVCMSASETNWTDTSISFSRKILFHSFASLSFYDVIV